MKGLRGADESQELRHLIDRRPGRLDVSDQYKPATMTHTPQAQTAKNIALRQAREAQEAPVADKDASKYSYFSAEKAKTKEFRPQYQSFFAKPLVLKSDLETKAVRPHFNPSYLSPDFHNLSEGPHFTESRWMTHNQRRPDQIHGDPFNQFPKHPVHDDTENEKNRMRSAGRIPTLHQKAAQDMIRSQTQVQDPNARNGHTYEPPKKVIPAAKDMVLVEAAGVPSNCSPYMHFQLRKYLRFPSANSTQKAQYTTTRAGWGEQPKYETAMFKYPDSVMRQSKYGVNNLTEGQAKDYLETRE